MKARNKSYVSTICLITVLLTLSLLSSCAKKPNPKPSGSSTLPSPVITHQQTDSGPTETQHHVPLHHDEKDVVESDDATEQTGLNLTSMQVSTQNFKNQDFVVLAIKPEDYQKLSVLSVDDQKKPLHNFKQLQNYIQTKHAAKIVFAMNAGMFEPDFSPAGLLIQNGQEIHAINREEKKDAGNFYLKENGIFFIDDAFSAQIVKRNEMTDEHIANALWATQSGPMLVIDGKDRDYVSESGKTNAVIRNGVATCKQGDEDLIILAMSKKPVTFPDFSELFSKHLNCQHALFLDGTVSQAIYDGHQPTDMDKPYAGFIVITEQVLEFEEAPAS